ncbi:hypothetical protein [Pseudonocardia xinjiangensis]|uniref:Uncharacterized protein n=1 Tax=Pseudonocardia xinjiangensis TaxID=75289 RepID=A0ABX1RF29_9PSEU|nr:hypothetical protein [Pseudonocardia xinjiangensis]NMH78019.1 hypothetical protein [Pseudonocardia xinjiangensis]
MTRAVGWLGVALLGAVLAGCAAGPVPPAPPQFSATPPPPDPVTVCVNQLTYWAAEDLRGAPDQGYDYQHRGLSSQQADALREIVDDARALGDSRSDAFVPDRVQAACASIIPR